jgi:branched-chain amino acid aminotransferase
MAAHLFVCYNGQYFPASEFIFSSTNRAFRYGDGLFETMKMVNGKVLFFKDHYQRLISGMKYLRMVVDKKGFSEQSLLKEIIALSEKNKTSKSCIVRLQVFRNSEGKYTPTKNDCSFIIETEPIKNISYIFNDKGLKLGLFNEEVKQVSYLSNIKTCNSLIYILAGIYKSENKFDDVLILNNKGTIYEAVSSNIFIVKNNEFITPPINDGCIDGIMRKQIIGILKSNKKKITESSLTVDHLLKADETFLTNAVNGITWVGAFKTKRYFNNQSRWLTEILNSFINP